jgi:hypothetical protein
MNWRDLFLPDILKYVIIDPPPPLGPCEKVFTMGKERPPKIQKVQEVPYYIPDYQRYSNEIG